MKKKTKQIEATSEEMQHALAMASWLMGVCEDLEDDTVISFLWLDGSLRPIQYATPKPLDFKVINYIG